MESSRISVSISCSTGKKVNVEVDPRWTIRELKGRLSELESIGTPSNSQRLIYSGQVLKDEKTIESYGVKEGHTVHLVRGAPRVARETPAPARETPPVAANLPQAGAGGLFPGMAGMPELNEASFQQMEEMIMRNPAMVQDMMNNPMVQAMLADPEVVRDVLNSNPQMQQLIQRNPDLGHMLQNPEILQQTADLMRNPALMQEMMRGTDQAMLNLEAQPEGFNRLAQLYHDLEPLMDGDGSGPRRSTPAAPPPRQERPGTQAFDMFSGNPPPEQPSARSEPRQAAARPPADQSSTHPAAPAFPAGMPPGGMPTSDQVASMLENPMMQQALERAADNPEFLRMFTDNPQILQMLEDPAMRRQFLNPDTLRFIGQLSQATQGAPGTGQPGAVPNAAQRPGLSRMMEMFGGLGAGGAMGAQGSTRQPVSEETLMERFATQLDTLEEMGFVDRSRNVRLLRAANGNVNVVVEQLLSGMP